MLRTLSKVVHGLRIQQVCLVNAFSIPRFQSLDLVFLQNSLECESSLIVVFPACLSVRVTRTSSYQAMTAHPHFAVLTHMLIDPQLVV